MLGDFTSNFKAAAVSSVASSPKAILMGRSGLSSSMNPNPCRSLSFVGLLLVSALALLLSGCTGAENAMYERRVETLPGVILATNTVYRTNVVVI